MATSGLEDSNMFSNKRKLQFVYSNGRYSIHNN
jgi:hypothetical protein